MVSTHSHPKVAAPKHDDGKQPKGVSTHSHPKVAAAVRILYRRIVEVSTHSHPKVAAGRGGRGIASRLVSTHSHPKVAAALFWVCEMIKQVSTHSHPKVAAGRGVGIGHAPAVSTHSHPKVAAAQQAVHDIARRTVSTHSHPKVAAKATEIEAGGRLFQHTATRRWLPQAPALGCVPCGFNTQPPEGGCDIGHGGQRGCGVSTHSHPKVAASAKSPNISDVAWFQHTATRRWLHGAISMSVGDAGFNTQPPEGGCLCRCRPTP